MDYTTFFSSAQESLVSYFKKIGTSQANGTDGQTVYNVSQLLLLVYLGFLLIQMASKQTRYSHRAVCTGVVLLLIQQCLGVFTSSPVLVGIMTLVCTVVHWHTMPSIALPAHNKAVLITGCDRGIGNQLARRLHRDGYQVFAGCLNSDSTEARQLVEECGDRLILVQLDVLDRQQVTNAIHTINQHLHTNKLWAVVNNAGICYIGNVEIMCEEDIDKVIAVNFLGPLMVAKTFLPLLRRSKGRLINIASNTGLAPVAHMAVYCASKSALATFSESLRYELKQWGMHVSTIIPSGYRTGILAYDKIATAERWWNSASNTVKQDFGKDCFIPEFKIANHNATTNPDLTSIVNTIACAVSAKKPKPFYYSGLLSQALPLAYTLLPSFLREPVMYLIADWFVFKPKALQTSHK